MNRKEVLIRKLFYWAWTQLVFAWSVFMLCAIVTVAVFLLRFFVK